VEHDPGHNTRFTGKEYEEDIGLYYFCARWYDADAGRFIGRDPFEGIAYEPRTINLYIYCMNNPIIFVDILGFCSSELKRIEAEYRKFLKEEIPEKWPDWYYTTGQGMTWVATHILHSIVGTEPLGKACAEWADAVQRWWDDKMKTEVQNYKIDEVMRNFGPFYHDYMIIRDNQGKIILILDPWKDPKGEHLQRVK